MNNRSDSPSMAQAKKIIAGEWIDSEKLLELVKKLKSERAFGLVRRALEKHQFDDGFKRELTLQLSLCTYKDPDMNPFEKLDQALEILKSLDNLDLKSASCTKDQETLGQAGAIFKRKWELTNQRVYLETSLAYYMRGYDQGVANDFGYTGINAAFVLDLLASVEISEIEIAAKKKQAETIRDDIIATLPSMAEQPGKDWLKQEWWFLVTLAESYFGLKRYEDASPWLQLATQLPNVPEWEWETTVRQLARLLDLHEKNTTPAEARKVFKEFLGDRAAGLDSLLKGKIGLALSGGGFRASLFHIGMLAKLAELDLLRYVEYLSCVSGGSIIGAHYYHRFGHFYNHLIING